MEDLIFETVGVCRILNYGQQFYSFVQKHLSDRKAKLKKCPEVQKALSDAEKKYDKGLALEEQRKKTQEAINKAVGEERRRYERKLKELDEEQKKLIEDLQIKLQGLGLLTKEAERRTELAERELDRARENWQTAVKDMLHLSGDMAALLELRGGMRAKLDTLPYGQSKGWRMVAVVGPPGTGKSTFIRKTMERLGHKDEAQGVPISHSGAGTLIATPYYVEKHKLVLVDCVGSTSSDIGHGEAIAADLLLVFPADQCRGSDFHGDLLVLAWRLREHMRTIFVLPKMDEWLKNTRLEKEPVNAALMRARGDLVREMHRHLQTVRPRAQDRHIALHPTVGHFLDRCSEGALSEWFAAGCLRCIYSTTLYKADGSVGKIKVRADEEEPLRMESQALLEAVRNKNDSGLPVPSDKMPAAFKQTPNGHMGGQCAASAEHVFPNGDTYAGTWKEGLPHGLGSYTWADGGCYSGSFYEGHMEGHGLGVWPDGKPLRHPECPEAVRHVLEYEGSWHRGEMEGYARVVFRDPLAQTERTYEGSWKGGACHGYGELCWDDSMKYVGSFLGGLPHGYGLASKGSEGYYEGTWKHGKPHGFGKELANGEVFEGFWAEGERCTGK